MVVDIAAGALGFAAVGWTGLTRAAWWSNDGESWTRSAIPDARPESGTFEAVAAGGQGFLAVGGIGEGRGRAAAWFSSTGQEWTRVEADLPVGYFSDVTSGLGGFVVVGVDQSEADWNSAVWVVSPDGLHASAAAPSEALASPDDDYLYKISSFAGGYAAFGQITLLDQRSCIDCYWRPQLWRAYSSIDGQLWHRDLLYGEPEGIDPPSPSSASVEASGDGLIAVGRGDDINRRVWLSSDGATWTASGDPVILDAPDGEFAEVADVLVADGPLVIGGTLGTGGFVAIGIAGH